MERSRGKLLAPVCLCCAPLRLLPWHGRGRALGVDGALRQGARLVLGPALLFLEEEGGRAEERGWLRRKGGSVECEGAPLLVITAARPSPPRPARPPPRTRPSLSPLLSSLLTAYTAFSSSCRGPSAPDRSTARAAGSAAARSATTAGSASRWARKAAGSAAEPSGRRARGSEGGAAEGEVMVRVRACVRVCLTCAWRFGKTI